MSAQCSSSPVESSPCLHLALKSITPHHYYILQCTHVAVVVVGGEGAQVCSQREESSFHSHPHHHRLYISNPHHPPLSQSHKPSASTSKLKFLKILKMVWVGFSGVEWSKKENDKENKGWEKEYS